MMSFKERMALLDKALSKHTPESLYKELSKYIAAGPTLNEYNVKDSELKLGTWLNNNIISVYDTFNNNPTNSKKKFEDYILFEAYYIFGKQIKLERIKYLIHVYIEINGLGK